MTDKSLYVRLWGYTYLSKIAQDKGWTLAEAFDRIVQSYWNDHMAKSEKAKLEIPDAVYRRRIEIV